MMKPFHLLALLGLLLLPSQSQAAASCGWVDGAAPGKAGNRGTTELVILGHWCTPEVEWAGLLDQVGNTAAETTDVTADPGGYSLDWEGFTTGAIVRARIDLDGVAPGDYDVCVRPVGELYPVCSLGPLLTVQEGTFSDLWVRITGQTLVRYGSTTEYLIWYGHDGNSPMPAGILFLAIPVGPAVTLGFDPTDYQYPSQSALLPASPTEVDTADYRIYPLYLRDIPPNPTSPLRVTLTWGGETGDHQLKAWWQGGTH